MSNQLIANQSNEAPKRIERLEDLEQGEPILYVEGGRKLRGHATISGAKNSALALMAGVLLSPEPCRLKNVPRLVDIRKMGGDPCCLRSQGQA